MDQQGNDDLDRAAAVGERLIAREQSFNLREQEIRAQAVAYARDVALYRGTGTAESLVADANKIAAFIKDGTVPATD